MKLRALRELVREALWKPIISVSQRDLRTLIAEALASKPRRLTVREVKTLYQGAWEKWLKQVEDPYEMIRNLEEASVEFYEWEGRLYERSMSDWGWWYSEWNPNINDWMTPKSGEHYVPWDPSYDPFA